jgi:hypothetical protein
MPTRKIYTVEPNEGGGYAVKADAGRKASAILPTQAKAIAEAKRLNRNAKPSVTRVEKTVGG